MNHFANRVCGLRVSLENELMRSSLPGYEPTISELVWVPVSLAAFCIAFFLPLF